MDFKDLIKKTDLAGAAISIDVVNQSFSRNILLFQCVYKEYSYLRETMSPYEEYLYRRGVEDTVGLLALTNIAGESPL